MTAGTGTVSPEEQRARHRRLVIIGIVVGILATAAIGWNRWVQHSLHERTSAATSELRQAYRGLDIASANDRWNAATLDPASPARGIWPEVDHAHMRDGDVKSDRIRARYEVEAGGTTRCLAAIARPGTSHNTVTIRTVHC